MSDDKLEGELRGPISDAPEDPRSDIEQAVQSRSDEVDANGAGKSGIGAGPGEDDGVSGTAGEVKNQDRMQQ
ncbi:hypothetical protein [Sphingomonas xinjiangensis]|uniref:Uncharacterized protein n=1 Tax=Sphingomonas xinjiangensis TaxID=643568 RepID=A0A840YJA2_9SPHN|nr:hypothetical protein [Sphingomonas xinjiangensis]MBB5708820.1 hypothetical protein [Sphingomonas xinjiangensis]